MRLAQLKGYEERQQKRVANEGSKIKSPVRAAVRAVGLLRPGYMVNTSYMFIDI